MHCALCTYLDVDISNEMVSEIVTNIHFFNLAILKYVKTSLVNLYFMFYTDLKFKMSHKLNMVPFVILCPMSNYLILTFHKDILKEVVIMLLHLLISHMVHLEY